jgi:hypothetical protein
VNAVPPGDAGIQRFSAGNNFAAWHGAASGVRLVLLENLMDDFLLLEHERDVHTATLEHGKQESAQQVDVIERAAVLLNMTRVEFVSLFDGVGDEPLEHRGRRILGRMMLEGLLDRGIADPPREPQMNSRGRWKFTR